MADPELATCVARAQTGDRAAFEKIVHLTARAVYAHIVATIRDRQKAEDLTQETFIAAWKAIGTLRKDEGALAWLLTLAKNKARDGLKYDNRIKRGGTGVGDAGAADQKSARSPAEPDQLPGTGPTPEQSAQRAEARDFALRMLDELPGEYRQALAMRYLAGADYDTIRRALTLTDGALRGILSRGMALMRERMSRSEHRL